jgi:hypothetical protein
LANHSRSRRARSRKRRPETQSPGGEAQLGAAAPSQPAGQRAANGSEGRRAGAEQGSGGRRAEADQGAKGRRASSARGAGKGREAGPSVRTPRGSPTAPTYGERPPAPWHPLPLSELLILVGAIVVVIGLRRLDPKNPEFSKGGATLIAGIAAVAIGTFEVTLREHRSGYRSHTVMLALLPVLVFDSLVVFAVSTFTTAPRLMSVGLLAVDLVIFVFLFRLLRARFLDARHARVLREG